MRKILALAVIAAGIFSSCDKVENPYPPQEITALDYSLYPGGDSVDYYNNEWPTFSENTNTLRNVVIEDFTGHKCIYCPIAGDTAEAIHIDYPDRAFVATIHAGPDGLGPFQQTDATFTTDWTCQDGLDIGEHFGSMPGSSFIGNPRGTVSRITDGGGQHTLDLYDWRLYAETAMASALKVNVQSAANYFASTRGVFLHTEIDVLDQGLTNDLYTVVYLIEDSIIGKQKMPNNTTNDSYVHREVLRDCIGSDWKGRQLTVEAMEGDKYYFNYSFALPSQYNPANMHFLVYVRDAVTEEIYQVIKQDVSD